MPEEKLNPATCDCPSCGAIDSLTVHQCGSRTGWTECLICGTWWNEERVLMGMI